MTLADLDAAPPEGAAIPAGWVPGMWPSWFLNGCVECGLPTGGRVLRWWWDAGWNGDTVRMCRYCWEGLIGRAAAGPVPLEARLPPGAPT